MLSMYTVSLKSRRKGMITAIMLGVVAGVIAMMAERADTIVTGGNATPLGFINTYTWLLVSATMFGPIGAVITTEVQALLGLITGANPLSWLWPVINLIFAVVVGIVSLSLSRFYPNIKLRSRLVLLSLTCALLDIPLTYVVVVLVLSLPFTFYLFALPMYITLQLGPATIISYTILRAILREPTLVATRVD
ncbi:MAG: hypothetical protein ABSA92_16095 [Candidatus Bathyarchaeia archaeon]